MLSIQPAYDRKEEVLALFSEYTAVLVATDPKAKACLEAQDYAAEIEDLEAKYGLPGGRLYIAVKNDETAGCICLRSLGDGLCEMKRLYVRPAFRGQGIAGKLVQKIMADARAMGYRSMMLDTLCFMKDAIRLYQKYGFYEVPPYNNSPAEQTFFMRLDL